METGYNTNLQSRLKDALASLKSLGISNTSAVGSNKESSDFVNSIFAIGQDGENFVNGNDEQKVQAAVNILEGILGMISSVKNHQAKANQDVSENALEDSKIEEEAEKKSNEVDAKVSELTNLIMGNSDNINSAIEEIKKLGGEDVEKLKLEIEAQLKIIEEAKQKLDKPEERENAIAQIQGAAQEIGIIVSERIPAIQAAIEAQTEIVDKNVEEIGNYITESAEAISEGVSEIQILIQKDTAAGVKAGAIATQGGVDTTTGIAEVTTGEAMNSNIVTALGSGGQGVKLILDGNSRQSAGATRISGGASNIASITATIGEMGGDLNEFANLVCSIGKVGEGVNTLVDLYNDAYITAIGTFDMDAINAANEALQVQAQSLSNTSENKEKQGTLSNGQAVTLDEGNEEFLNTKNLRVNFGL